MRFDWPVANPGDPASRITSPGYPSRWKIGLGYNKYYLLGGTSPAYHEGDDISIPENNEDVGTPVYAIGDGIVIYAEMRDDSWDGLVVIEHPIPGDDPAYSRSGHLTGLQVKAGDRVENGTVIGYVGNAKNRFPYHLHFSICVTDAWVAKPWYWQKADRQFVLNNCVDPVPWIQAHRVLDDSGETPMPDYVGKPMKISTPAGILNMRLSPYGTVVDQVKTGTSVTAYGDTVAAGGYSWQKIEVASTLHTAWVATKYLTPIVTVPPPPVARGSGFGLNLIGPGAFNEALNTIGNLARAGKPLALAIAINEGKIVQAIKAQSPQTVVVFRSTNMPAGIDNPSYAAGRDFFSQHWPVLAQGVGANFYSFCNEWLIADEPKILAAQVQAYVGMMDAARAANVKITVGDLSVATPHPALDNILEPMWTKAEQFGFALNYHAYTASGTNDPNVNAAGRTMRWTDFVRAHPSLKVIIGEFGTDSNNSSFPGTDAAVTMCQQYDVMLKPYPQVLGYAYFAAKGSTDSWQHSDVTPALPEIEAWLRGA